MSVKANSAVFSGHLPQIVVFFPSSPQLLVHIDPRPSGYNDEGSFGILYPHLLRVLLFPVIGALIGKQEGRNIEVMNSFELLSHTVEEKIIIDKEYYYTKEEQCERGIEVGRGVGGNRCGEDGGVGKK